MASLKYPILTLFARIAIIELLPILLIVYWIPPDSGAELEYLIVMLAIFCLNGIVAIAFFFMHRDTVWKAWLILAFVSPFYYDLVNEVWMIITNLWIVK